jgi:hypothetical protein
MGIGVRDITQKEKSHREARLRKIKGAMSSYKSGMTTFPNLGPDPELGAYPQIAIEIPEQLIRSVALKIVRGCEFILGGKVVEEPYEVRIFFVHPDDLSDATARMFKVPTASITHLGPGFKVTRSAAHDDPNVVMYEIVIWGTIRFYAAIMQAMDFLAPL